jgi:hypothetical protein
MAVSDGMAGVRGEMKSSEPRRCFYWQDEKIHDPRFQALRVVKQRTCDYILNKGGINAGHAEELQHYPPWLPLRCY